MLLMLHEQATTCQSFLLVVATATIASGLVSISFLAWCQSQKNALLWQTLRKGNTDASTTANRRSLVEGENACGCLDCTASVLDRNANGYTCQERISYLVEQESFTEHDACTKIATQYPWSCGPECHPAKCDGQAPHLCGSTECTTDMWNRLAGNVTCGDRIIYMQIANALSEDDACAFVAQEFPTICGACNPPTSTVPIFCQCRECTFQAWETNANGFSCGARIQYLQSTQGLSEEAACTFVSEEYGAGVCGPVCHPGQCDGLCQNTTAAPTAAPLPDNTDGNLYCFPPPDERNEFINVWDKYSVQVKESPGEPCGPGPNWFSRKTVFYHRKTKLLKLEYRYLNEKWQGSEARILLPTGEQPFSYGEYSFQIKSIIVRRGRTILGRSRLPPNLVLGFFTYDPTVSSSNAPYNREIDLEISQWGNGTAPDVHFLTQPDRVAGPHFPQDLRVFSGGSEGDFAVGRSRFYNFTWSPNAILWKIEIGRNKVQTYQYGTAMAHDLCTEDYVQCPASNVEVRLNLWNMWPLHGGSREPDFSYLGDIGGDYRKIRVQLRLESFTYSPLDIQGATSSAACSRDCQCESNLCSSGQCTPPTAE